MCVFISFHRRNFSWLKQSNKCNTRDQASDAVLRKSLCVKYIHHHIVDNHSRDLKLATVQECQLNRADILEKICWSGDFSCDAQLSPSRWRTRVETSWWEAPSPRQGEFQSRGRRVRKILQASLLVWNL